MEATMQLVARPEQLAVMSTPTLSLADAVAAAAQRQRRSVVALMRRAMAVRQR